MILKLDAAIKEEPWYPSNRRFTETEARLDLLLSNGVLDITLQSTISKLAVRWNWMNGNVQDLLSRLKEEKFLERDWYLTKDDESLSARRGAALQVIDTFNSIFNRSIQLNDYRLKIISARIKEGKKLKPPIGLEQFRAVFAYKKEEWLNDPEMEKYLQIETLCAAKHFMNYLDQARLAYARKQQKAVKAESGKFDGVMFK